MLEYRTATRKQIRTLKFMKELTESSTCNAFVITKPQWPFDYQMCESQTFSIRKVQFSSFKTHLIEHLG
jgi:hypothetical protein